MLAGWEQRVESKPFGLPGLRLAACCSQVCLLSVKYVMEVGEYPL